MDSPTPEPCPHLWFPVLRPVSFFTIGANLKLSWVFCYLYFKLTCLDSLINIEKWWLCMASWPDVTPSMVYLFKLFFLFHNYDSLLIWQVQLFSWYGGLAGKSHLPTHPSIHPLSSWWINRFAASIYQGTLLSIVSLPKEKNQVLFALKDLRVQKGRTIMYIINYGKMCKIVKCH